MMTGLRTLLVSSSVIFLGAAACTGGGGGGIALSNLGDRYEDSLCRAQVDCGLFPDLQTCLDTSYFEEGSDLPQLEAGVAAGRADYHSDMASACIGALANLLADCEIFFDEDGDEIADTCDQVFTGNVELGGECYDSEECAGDAACEIDCQTECCPGVCVAVDPEPDPVGIGSDCSEAECVAGAWCRYDSGLGTYACEPVDNEGEACEGFGIGSCADGLICDGYPEGTCKRPAGEGETCDPALGYGYYSCLRVDNWCDPTDTTCKKRPGIGEACSVEVDNCAQYAYCGTEGTCVQLPGSGEACGGTQEVTCLGDLECENLVCVAPEPEPICGEPA